MNKSLSNKIANLNFILIIMIVVLHASFDRYINTNDFSYDIIHYIYCFINTLADMAVPTFFMLSGFLLFRKYNKDTIKRKLISRIYTLVIPYFLWSLIYIIYYFIISKINIIEYNDFDFSRISNVFKYFIFASCAQTMWFVRVLIIYSAISPFIYYIFEKLKKKSLILIVFTFVINIILDFQYSSPVFWLPIYLLGGFCGNIDFDLMKIKVNGKIKKILIVVFLFICTIVAVKYGEKSKIYYCYRIISPIFIWIVYDILNLKLNFKFKNDSFFIFCTHLSIIQIIRKVIIKIIGSNPIISLIGYVITIFVTVMIIYIMSKVLKKYFSNIYKILIGGREKR